MLTKLGISTAPLAICAPRRTIAPGRCENQPLELLGVPAGEFGRDLFPPEGAARPARDRLHRIEAKAEQHRLFSTG